MPQTLESNLNVPPAGLDLPRVRATGLVATVEHHASLRSTNDRAREVASGDGVDLPALIVADEQTAGRGRGSNRWWTGAGSLAFSLLLDPAMLRISRAACPQLSLAAAVAVVDVIAPRLSDHEVGLHWPNDVFVNGRKLAGVLVEALASGLHIVGIGLNSNNSLAEAPPEIQNIAITLRDLTGHDIDQTALLIELLNRLFVRFEQLASAPPILSERYDGLCLLRDWTLSIQAGDQITTGRCTGIAADGALLLETTTGSRTFHGGALVKKKPPELR